MSILKKGLVQVYTGEGKGKSTAAFGLAARMLGAGGRVYICQFLKPAELRTGEAVWAERFSDRLIFERLKQSWNLASSSSDPDQVEQMSLAIEKKLTHIKQLAAEGEYDLIILDEIVFCLSKHLATWESIASVIDGRAEHVELVLTGRGADERLCEYADLVTVMQNRKHPYQKDVGARKGIEY